MENQSKELTPPEDLAGYQHVTVGHVKHGDVLVWGESRIKHWANVAIGHKIPYLDYDVYRKMECPKHEGQTKPWINTKTNQVTWPKDMDPTIAKTSGEGQTKFEVPNGSRILTEEEKADFAQRIKNTGLVSMPTGSLRENKKGKGRFDLIPYEPTRQLAVHFEDGGVRHGDRNWELGQPLSTYLNSAKRHAAQAGNLKDENHAISSCWNFFCLIQTAKWIEEGKLPKELDDINWLGNK